MRCSSILLQGHGNRSGSTAFVVICLAFFIKLFVDRKKTQYVAQTPDYFEGGFVWDFGVHLWFVWCLFFFFSFFLRSVDEAIQERVKFREISEQGKCFLMQAVLL